MGYGVNEGGLDLLHLEQYDVPKLCEKCGGVMVFQGVGEYRCEDCGEKAFDDYGKVRNYLEQHKGANMSQIVADTGVSRSRVLRMLKEGRFEVSENSMTFLKCEICGVSIRWGKYCPECEKNMHEKLEEETRKMHQENRNISGIVNERQALAHGERRFMRGENGGRNEKK